MNSYVKPDVNLPFSLHDARITGGVCRNLEGEEGELEFEFSEGIFRVQDGSAVRTGRAVLLFSGVDFSFSHVYTYTGNVRREMEFAAFAEELKKHPLEVTDEAYGYHSTYWRGYRYVRGNWRELEIEICHTQKTQYRWEDQFKE